MKKYLVALVMNGLISFPFMIRYSTYFDPWWINLVLFSTVLALLQILPPWKNKDEDIKSLLLQYAKQTLLMIAVLSFWAGLFIIIPSLTSKVSFSPEAVKFGLFFGGLMALAHWLIASYDERR